jgi:hypothetical protein
MAGLMAIVGEEQMLGTLVQVISSGKQAIGRDDAGDGTPDG